MKRISWLFLAFILLVGCKNEDVNTSIPKVDNDGGNTMGSRIVFSISGSDATRANVPLKDAASRLNYFNFIGSSLLKRRVSSSMDIGYGSVVDTLTAGTYRVCFVGDNGVSSYASSDGEKVWFDRVTDTFWGKKDVVVSDGAAQSESVVLKRCVGRVTILALDGVPAEAKKIRLTATNVADTLSVLTGMGIVRKSVYVREITYTGSIGQKNTSYSIYTFLPSEGEHTISLRSEVLNDLGTVIYSYNFGDVTVVRNRTTEFSGDLFKTRSTGMSIMVDNTWDSDEKYSF